MKNASFFARVQQACREMFYSHPQNCQRAYEIDRWKSSANYRTLIRENMQNGGLSQKNSLFCNKIQSEFVYVEKK